MTGKTVETNLDVGILGNDDWLRRWDVGEINFHQPVHDKFLDDYEERLFEGKKKSVFAPLCGKALDLIWMYKRGHSVTGVELAVKAVQELFEENSIEHDITDVKSIGKLYKSKDGRLKVYCVDLFDMTADLCGQFDMIWDSKSLVAINIEDHKTYKGVLLSLLKPDGIYYLSTIYYDSAVHPGPPHSISNEMVKALYGDVCSVEMVVDNATTNNDTVSDEELAKFKGASRIWKGSKFVSWRWYCLRTK